jgi:sphingolipid 4-desaturase/C4-monooxygenase
VDGWDVDLPTSLEKSAVSNLAAKLAWVSSYLAIYGLRPLIVRPKKPDASDLLCLGLVIGFDAAVLYFWGVKSLTYLLAGTLLGGGLHPMAGHLIAEHYCFVSGQETYSYYGPLNALTYNVGFHNEHHDFPQIPHTRLHKLKGIAPEFYEPLARHASWCWVIWTFLTDNSVGPWTRIKRVQRGEATATVPGVVGEYIASLERQEEEEKQKKRKGGAGKETKNGGDNDENASAGSSSRKKLPSSPLTPASLRKIFTRKQQAAA